MDIGIDIGMAIFVELFCSIHMSVFVLMPLAAKINPEQKTHTFIKFFIIRAVILLIGNFITPAICMLDFFAIFVGAFIVIPVMEGLAHEKKLKQPQKYTNNAISKNEYKRNYKDLSDSELANFGILDAKYFKNELYELFVSYENAYSDFDYNTLNSICTNKYFHTVSNELSYFENLKQKRIFENFTLHRVKIDNFFNNGYVQTVSALIDIFYNDYIIDEKGNFIKGNKYTSKNRKYYIVFHKDIRDISNQVKCKNCGATINKFKAKCDYCGSNINNKMTWKINSIEKVEEPEIIQNNPIKMN